MAGGVMRSVKGGRTGAIFKKEKSEFFWEKMKTTKHNDELREAKQEQKDKSNWNNQMKHVRVS